MFFKKKQSKAEEVIDAVFSLLTPQELETINTRQQMSLVDELKAIFKDAKPKYSPEESKSIIKPFISFLRSEFQIDSLCTSITTFFDEKLFDRGNGKEN